MATHIMFGTLNQALRKAVSAKRTEGAMALIKKRDIALKAGYALRGEVDFVGMPDRPDTARVIQVSVGLGRLPDLTFGTAPAVGIEYSTGSQRSRPSD